MTNFQEDDWVLVSANYHRGKIYLGQIRNSVNPHYILVELSEKEELSNDELQYFFSWELTSLRQISVDELGTYLAMMEPTSATALAKMLKNKSYA